jgi:hypothetical protein
MGIRKKLSNPKILVYLSLFFLMACASARDTYIDPNMDFGAIKTVAVMPFMNLTRETAVAERVRDVFVNSLLATGAVYVLPIGEVARGAARAELASPSTLSADEAIKLGGIIKVQAIIMGTVREYGEVRSGTASANIISLSMQMIETQTGKVVWTASSTKGGITFWDRLLGSGGKPMNVVTKKAADDLISQLLK